jgi:hypothetical protein
MNAVKINGLSTRELVQQIERRGVDFELSASDESDLQGVGARPEIIAAARSNYRPATVAAAPPRVNTSAPPRVSNTTNPAANVPDGPPLSKAEIVTMLQGGIAAARVEQFVEKRGVNFQPNAQTAKEIKAAGGTNSLLGAITEKSTADVAASNNSGNDSPFGPAANTPAANNAPDYDDLIDRANSAAATSSPRPSPSSAPSRSTTARTSRPPSRRCAPPSSAGARPPSASTTTTTAPLTPTARAPSSSPRRG